MSDPLMTTDEVSEFIRVPAATLRFWRHLGDRGPRSFRLGRRVLYRRSDVEQWIDAQYAEARGADTAGVA